MVLPVEITKTRKYAKRLLGVIEFVEDAETEPEPPASPITDNEVPLEPYVVLAVEPNAPYIST